MPGSKVVLVLFRSLLRNAKILDRFRAFKVIGKHRKALGIYSFRYHRQHYHTKLFGGQKSTANHATSMARISLVLD